MADIYAKVRQSAALAREISDEIGYTVRISARHADELIDRPTYSIAIEGMGLPFGSVTGTGDTADKALGEAMARLEDATMRRAA